MQKSSDSSYGHSPSLNCCWLKYKNFKPECQQGKVHKTRKKAGQPLWEIPKGPSAALCWRKRCTARRLRPTKSKPSGRDKRQNRPSGRRRLCAVNSFCPAKRIAQGRLCRPRALKSPKGGANEMSGTQQRSHDFRRDFFVGLCWRKRCTNPKPPSHQAANQRSVCGLKRRSSGMSELWLFEKKSEQTI